MRSSAARAIAIGVERDPGHTTASVTPARAHSSTSVAQKVALRSPVPAAASSEDTERSEVGSATPGSLRAGPVGRPTLRR